MRTATDPQGETCPQCQVQLQQKAGAFELVRRNKGGPDSRPGLPVSVYSCPRCGHLQIYDLSITARL